MENGEKQRYEYNVETAKGQLSEGQFEKLLNRNAACGFRLNKVVNQDNSIALIFERSVE